MGNVLKRYNGTNWEAVGGTITGDTLPIGSEVDYTGTDIPAGWEEVAPQAQILWTNSNPTSNFAGQTITISSTDYDVLEIFYVSILGNNQIKSVRTIKNANSILDFYDGYSSKGALRTVTISGNQITFSNSFYNSGSGSQNYCVPVYIVGYKTGLFS